eukprot:scaffold242649_cov29-Tisochrysis_lutea.AAC.2
MSEVTQCPGQSPYAMSWATVLTSPHRSTWLSHRAQTQMWNTARRDQPQPPRWHVRSSRPAPPPIL